MPRRTSRARRRAPGVAAFLLAATLAVALAAPVMHEGRRARARLFVPVPTSHTPAVLQTHPAGCGAAVLATVLAHHGRPVAQADLLAAAPPGPDGVSLAALRDLAHRHGLRGTWRRAPRGRLPAGRYVAHLDAPYGHVVWVAARAGRYLHLHDPERGFEVWHVDAFRARFSGRYLRLEATS